PFDEALEPALQDGVVRRKILLPGAVALFQPKRIQRVHAERLQAVLLAGLPDGVEDGRRVFYLAVDFPAELAGEGDTHQLTPAPGDLGRLVREPRKRKVGVADFSEDFA